MTVEFLQEAELELTEAALWYEDRDPGLGRRLRDEVAHVISRIAEDPMLWRIVVVAVGHGHRKPDYWKSRAR